MALLFVTTWSLELVSIVPQVASGSTFHLQQASSSAGITSQGSKKSRSEEGVPTSRDLDSQSTSSPTSPSYRVLETASCLGSMCRLSFIWPTTAADTVLRRPHALSTVTLSVVFVCDYVAPGRGTEEAIRHLRINVAICIPVKD
ncbi:hypothetical protein EI94DRAFT_1732294 [Lactarius quietus]|nr:hypothetical protein EI94DRAFT_1732294 [Lactarius quietus]